MFVLTRVGRIIVSGIQRYYKPPKAVAKLLDFYRFIIAGVVL